MKYIVVKENNAHDFAIVFDETLTHKDIAQVHRASRLSVQSAGFCSIGEFGVTAWGRSDSLNIKGRPEDVKIIENMLKTH